MTRLLSAGPAPLIVFAVLVLVAAVLAVESGRRRLRCWRADRVRVCTLAEDVAMAARAELRRASFVRAAEELAARNAAAADRELDAIPPPRLYVVREAATT